MIRFLWIVLAVLFAATPANADPVSAAIVFVDFLSTVGVGATTAAFIGNAIIAVGGFAIETAVSMGASLLISKLARPSSANSAAEAAQARQASVIQLQLGETPRRAIVGRAATGGSLLDGFTYGGQYGTDWAVRVIRIADHRCDALEGFYVGDDYVAFTADGAVAGYNGQLEVYWLSGTEAQALPDWFVTASAEALGATTDTQWNADDNCAGVAVAIVQIKADAPDATTPTWSGGQPQLLFVVRGLRCYDPRHDSAVGGLGPQRSDDPSTWVWSENAKVVHYNWQRGVYACDRIDQPDQLLVGRGLSDLEAPAARVFAPANLCDELVDIPGGTEPRYRVGGVIEASQSFADVEQMFADAMGGFIVQPDGGVDVEPGQAKTPVASITDADLVADAAVQWTPFKSDSDRINTVIPRYVEPSQKWSDYSADVIRDTDDIAADGGVRDTTLPLSLVTSRTQAKRLAVIKYRQARLERSGSIVLGPRFAALEEGDWITWTSARRTGGQPVDFRITTTGQGQEWRNALALEETGLDVYGFGGDPTEAGTFTPHTPPDALALAGVSAEAIQIEGDSGALVPAVRFHWATPVDAGVARIRGEVRLAGGTETASVTTDAVNASPWVVTNGVPPNATIEVRLIPLGAAGRPIIPSDWIGLSTADLVATNIKNILDKTVEEAVAQLNDASAKAAALLVQAEQLGEAVLQGLDAFQQQGKTVELLSYEDDSLSPIKAVFRSELNDLSEGDTRTLRWFSFLGLADETGHAWVFDLDTVKVSPTETMATRLTSISSQLSTNAANIVTEATTRAGVDNAYAALFTTINTVLGDHAATLTTYGESIDGIELKWGVSMDIDNRVTGFSLIGGPTSTSAVFVVDDFAIQSADGSKTVTFGVSGSWVYAANLSVGLLEADTVRTSHLVGAAVTDTVRASNFSGAALDTGQTQVLDWYYASAGGDIDVLVYIQIENLDVATGAGYVAELHCDGSLVEEGTSWVKADFQAGTTHMFNHQPSAGTHHYEVLVNLTSGSPTSGVTSTYNRSRLIEYKR